MKSIISLANYDFTSVVRSATQQTTVVQSHMARRTPHSPIQVNCNACHTNIDMHQQMCSLRTNDAAHSYSVSDLINYPMPRPHTRGHRGRLRSEATSSRTKDNRLIPAGEDHISKQARLTDGSNATPTLPPKSKISFLQATAAATATESQRFTFDAIWRQNTSWG